MPETVAFLIRNSKLVIMNFVLVFYVITVILFIVLDLRSDAWGYLISSSFLRAEEFIAMYIQFSFLQNYSLVSSHPYENWKKAWSKEVMSSKTENTTKVEGDAKYIVY